jgi:hypothetical protein
LNTNKAAYWEHACFLIKVVGAAFVYLDPKSQEDEDYEDWETRTFKTLRRQMRICRETAIKNFDAVKPPGKSELKDTMKATV